MVQLRTIDARRREVLDRSVKAAGRPTSLTDVVLRPAAGNAFEHAVEQLARAIRLGAFADGELIPPERDLAERLGVSRNTLRDAIAALRESGLVATRRGRGGGTRVTYVGEAPAAGGRQFVRSGAAMEDALNFRRVVEPGAAWLAAAQPLAADQRAWLSASVHDVVVAPDSAAHPRAPEERPTTARARAGTSWDRTRGPHTGAGSRARVATRRRPARRRRPGSPRRPRSRPRDAARARTRDPR